MNSFTKTKHFDITSCFSCVYSRSWAAFLSVFSESLSCWDTARNVFPGVRLCQSGSRLLLLSSWTRRARRGQESPWGSESECGTEVSRRTELWEPHGAAGCFSARVDGCPRLHTRIKHHSMNPILNVLYHPTVCEMTGFRPFSASLRIFSFSLLLRAEMSACSVSTTRSLFSTSVHAFCPTWKTKNEGAKLKHSVNSPHSTHLQLWLQGVVHLIHFTDFSQHPIGAEEFRAETTEGEADLTCDYLYRCDVTDPWLCAGSYLCFFMVRL